MYKLLAVVCLLATKVVAGQDNVIPDESSDLSIQVALNSRTHELEFLDRALEDSVILRPNTPYILQTILYYRGHELRLETDSLLDIGVDDRRGASSYTDIKYSGFLENTKYSVYYGRYKGFYVVGQRDPSGNFFTFNDVETKRYGAQLTSYRSEPRMVSVNSRSSINYRTLPEYFGTVAYGLLLDVSSIKNIPNDPAILSQISNSDLLFFSNLRLITLSPFVGVIGRASSGGYFAEGGLNIGYGIQRQRFDRDGVEKSATDYSFVGAASVSFGKTMRNGVVGVVLGVETVEPSVEKNEFSIATVDASLFWRINF